MAPGKVAVKVKDKVTGGTTWAYQFDGTDEGGTLRQVLSSSDSVPGTAEVVVGSQRLYLPQFTTLPDASTEIETEIVLRTEWLVWDLEDQRWEIYPTKLFGKYYEEVPDGEA